MYIIANKKNEYLLNALKKALPKFNFQHIYSSIEDIFIPGLTIREDSISYTKENGLKIARKSKSLLILCDKDTINCEQINNITNILNDFFHIYIEDISDIKTFVENNIIDNFDFKIYVNELFENYHDIDYLLIYTK